MGQRKTGRSSDSKCIHLFAPILLTVSDEPTRAYVPANASYMFTE
jgi:hypothetical protein